MLLYKTKECDSEHESVKAYDRLHKVLSFLQSRKEDYIMPKYYMPRLITSKYRGIQAFKELCREIGDEPSYVKEVVKFHRDDNYYVMEDHIGFEDKERMTSLLGCDFEDHLYIGEKEVESVPVKEVKIDMKKTILDIVENESMNKGEILELVQELLKRI